MERNIIDFKTAKAQLNKNMIEALDNAKFWTKSYINSTRNGVAFTTEEQRSIFDSIVKPLFDSAEYTERVINVFNYFGAYTDKFDENIDYAVIRNMISYLGHKNGALTKSFSDQRVRRYS